MRASLPLFALWLLGVACGGAPGGPAAAPPASGLPTPVDAAVTQVRALLDLPDERRIDDAFSKDFLAHTPVDSVQAVFLPLHAVAPCNFQKILSTEGQTSGKVHLACQTGGVDVTLAVEPVAPYKMTLLILKATR